MIPDTYYLILKRNATGTLPERWNPRRYCVLPLSAPRSEKMHIEETKMVLLRPLTTHLSLLTTMITGFKTYLIHLGYGKSSIGLLPRCAASFLSRYSLTDAATATPAQVLSFYEWLHERPNERSGGAISEAYIHIHMYALRLFCGWCEQTGLISSNPVSALTFGHKTKGRRQPLTPEEVQALFAAATTDRERALLHLLYSCGLRRTEVEMLDTADVHFKARMLYVRQGKGSKRRAIPLTEKVSDALEVYQLTERINGPINKGKGYKGYREPLAFMLNKRGGRLTGQRLAAVLRELTARAGIGRELSPHHLRHSIATHLLAAGVPLEQVAVFLGHSRLEATQIYTKVAGGQLRNL